MLRTVGGLSFRVPFVVRPVGLDEDAAGEAGAVRQLRGGQQGVFVRIDCGYALMIPSDASRWRWPSTGEAMSVMLFRAVSDAWVPRELRRLGDPQRRDALYKAELRTVGPS